LVDDGDDVRKIVEFGLEKLGFEVSKASNGRDALAKARSTRPDLVLLCYRMPLMDGGEALKEMKSEEQLRSVPVILMTASADL